MTANLLLDNLAAIAAGPGGVSSLRKLFLQLAIQGKLGTRDTKDEPASELLEKIRLARAEIDKNWRKVDPISDNDLPYRIPEGWIWNRLGNIVILKSGLSFDPSSELFDCGIPYIKVGDMNYPGNERTITTSSRFVEKTEKNERGIIPRNSIIFPKRGGAIATNKKRIVSTEIFIDSNTMAIICPDSIHFGYLYYWFLQIDLWLLNSGTSVPQINNKDIEPLLFPLPPLAEQHRIVEKIDRLMALCDDLEIRQMAEREERRRLRTASLTALEEAETTEEAARAWLHVAGEFGRLVDTLEDVAELRKTFLQIAVRGSFRTQDADDEPAGKLVDRIGREKERLMKDGKIKIEKKPESANEIEIPFAIPTTWKWVKLSTISEFVTDGDHYPPQRVSDGIAHLTAKNVRKNKFNLNGCTFISHEDFEKVKLRYEPNTGDIIVTCVGTIGQTAIVPQNFVFSADRNLAAIRLIKGTFLPKFMELILNAPYWQNKIMTGSESTAQPHLYLKDLRAFCIPVPPFAEQHRIVEKINQLMTQCDSLEAGIRARDAALEAFAAAACRAVLGGPAPVAVPAEVAVRGTGQQRLPV